MRTAIIGCSHSAGYSYAQKDKTRDRWNDNNWAKYYINNQNKDGAIFAVLVEVGMITVND